MVDWRQRMFAHLKGDAGSFDNSLSIRALGVAEQNLEAVRRSVALRLWRIQCVESTCLKYCLATAAECMGQQGAARVLVRYNLSLVLY